MGFDKNKCMRNAERFLVQGRIPAAIDEYRQIVENDFTDYNTQNMLGDLYVKADDKYSAINCYMVVAEHYRGEGFAKKAIAIFNKILKLNPDAIDVSVKLAELYQSRGALVEACAHYDAVAKFLEKHGQAVEAFTIWEKIASISPRDGNILLKIAEFYFKKHRLEQAAKIYSEAGSRFLSVERFHDASASYSKALEIEPADTSAIRGYVNAQVGLGYPEEAASFLDQFASQSKNSGDIIDLLLECYLEIDQPATAEKALKEVQATDPKIYYKFLDIADYYLKWDDLDSAARLLNEIADQLLVSNEPERLRVRAEEVVTRNPEHILGLRLLIKFYGWHKDEKLLKGYLEQLMEAATLNNMPDEERFAISQLLLLSPQADRLIRRLKDLDGVAQFAPNAGDEFASEDASLNFELEAEQNNSEHEIPTFESFNNLLNGTDGGGAFIEDAVSEFGSKFDAASYPPITLTEADLTENHVSLGNGILEGEKTLNDDSVSDIEEIGIPMPTTGTISGDDAGNISEKTFDSAQAKPEEGLTQSFIETDEIVSQAEDDESYEFEPNSGADGSVSNEDLRESEPEFSENGVSEDSAFSVETPEPVDSNETATEIDIDVYEQKENLRFYIDQGYVQVAVHTIRELSEKYGRIAELEEIRNELEAGGAFEDYPEEHFTTSTTQNESEAAVSEYEIELSSGTAATKDSADENEQVEASGSVANNETDVPAPEHSVIDFAAELLDEEDKESETASARGGKSAEENELSSINWDSESPESELFEAEDENHELEDSMKIDIQEYSNEEYELHYHHAVAYQEMGLLEDAVREFRLALSTIDSRNDSGRYFQCCNLIASCHRDAG
ncbi:MAG: hypothetical protein ACK5NT_10650, partial [Pyrinomonadaceae bacterium]